MPKIEVEGYGVYEVADGTRLVRALEDSGVDILHRCGGFAKCTTCRVQFMEGEPDTMTKAERDKLTANDLLGEVRLSCQIKVTHDMKFKPVMTLGTSDLDDPGPQPKAHVTPEPEWVDKPV